MKWACSPSPPPSAWALPASYPPMFWRSESFTRPRRLIGAFRRFSCAAAAAWRSGWLAGVLYDHFGTYAPAFAAGVGANAINLAIVGTLVFRHRWRSPRLA